MKNQKILFNFDTTNYDDCEVIRKIKVNTKTGNFMIFSTNYENIFDTTGMI